MSNLNFDEGYDHSSPGISGGILWFQFLTKIWMIQDGIGTPQVPEI